MPKVIYTKEKEFYDSYPGEKASYVTFIGRIKRNKIAFEIAIIPGKLEESRKKLKEKWSNYRNQDPLWVFYHNYLGDKPSFRYFKEKVNAGMPMEEAIKFEKKKGEFLKEQRIKPKKKVRKVSISNDESNYYIRVTYSKEEANVIRKVYIEMIDENEDRMLSCEIEEMNKLIKATEQLKKELIEFNRWNPQ